MSLFTIIGVLLDMVGVLILAYPSLNPEDKRFGRKVGPKDDLQKAMNTLSRERPPYWTDRKIYAVGLAVTVIGAIFTISGLLGLIDP